MTFRKGVHAAGRMLTRGLLHPRWRDYTPIAWTYLQLYLAGKKLTERRELATLRGLIRPGMVIADIGANVGFYTLNMASMVGPTGRILAFEPDAFNFGLLEARTRRARAVNVDTYRMALGNTSGHATLYCSAYNRADNRLNPSHGEAHVEPCEVPVCRLDEFMTRREAPALEAIKIDVQGAEADVLQGARNVLARGLQWIWIEFSPPHLRGAGTDPERFVSLLEKLEMNVFEIDQAGCLQPFSGYLNYSTRIGEGYGDLVLLAR